MMQTDVLIIGSGLAGTIAAYTIIQHSDLQVIQLSDGSGASPYIHGFCMPVGKDDSMELFYQDTMQSGYGQSNPGLARELCTESLSLEEFFGELDLRPDRDGSGIRLLHALGSSVPRIASIQNHTGPAVYRAVMERLKAKGNYRMLAPVRAVKLLKAKGCVVGAYCYDKAQQRFFDIAAKTVILATGGFGGIFPESTNSSDIGGDGCAMAYEAGATLVDMEFIQFEPCVAVWPQKLAGKGIVTTMFYDGAVLRGADGRRFMKEYAPDAECVPKDILSRCICDEIRKHGATVHGGVWFDARKVPQEKWENAYCAYLARYLEFGIDLRKEMAEIVPSVHTTCGGVKIDTDCRSDVPGLLVCGEAAGGIHGANRLGGNAGSETLIFGRIAGTTALLESRQAIRLPEKSKELSHYEKPKTQEIQEILVSRAVQQDCVTREPQIIQSVQQDPVTQESQKIQADQQDSVTREPQEPQESQESQEPQNIQADQQDPVTWEPQNIQENLPVLREQLRQTIRNSMNVIRTGTELETGVRRTKHILELLRDGESYECIRLYNDALTARLAMTAARMRTSSIGCHVRSDSAMGIEECSRKYRIELCNIQGQEKALRKDI